MDKPRILTGDTPTGSLHLGHYVGSLENRLSLLDKYDCYFIIANTHAFTTKAREPKLIWENTIQVALDYLAVGFSPDKCTIFLQSEIPAITEMTFMFSMLVSYPRVLRNPTLKEEIVNKNLGDNYPFGFLLYAVGQVADILMFKPDLVPVGEDQLPHLEMAREIARTFNHIYCGVPHGTDDHDHLKHGGLFPIFQPLLGRNKRLVGLGGPDANGNLLKMSKSLNNAILLSDEDDQIAKKIMSMYTDPSRLKKTDKGHIENNPLWIFHDTFNNDTNWLLKTKDRYRNGDIGDVEVKKRLIDILVNLISPIRTKRKQFEQDLSYVKNVLKQGSHKANIIANSTLREAKEKMYLLL